MKLNKILHWKSYCSEPLELIENYQQALAENFKGWCIHHRLEIKSDGTRVSRQELKDNGLYFHRPASELVFMRNGEHCSLHNIGNTYMKGRHHSAEMRKKMSKARSGENNPFFGKHHSAEMRKKMSEAHKGKHHSEETRKKISESKKGENHPMFGKHHSAESKKKLSECRIGKHYPKLSEAKKGLHLHWYNNGDTSILAKTCPEGFEKSRMKLCAKASLVTSFSAS